MRTAWSARKPASWLFAVIAGKQRHAGPLHQRFRRGFGSHRAHRRGWRADEDQSGFGAGLGECRVLGEEAVAGVDRIGIGLACRGDDAGNVKVAVSGRRRADRNCSVSRLYVKCIGVNIGVDSNGGDAHAPRGARDAAGDLAAVGNQQRAEHPAPVRFVPLLNSPQRRRGRGDRNPALRARRIAFSLCLCVSAVNLAFFTSGTPRTASVAPAHSMPPTAPAPAHAVYRPDR